MSTAPATAPAAAPVRPVTPDPFSLRDRVLSGHRFPVYSLAFSPDGQRLASGSLDRTARLWELGDGREVASFPGTSPFTSLDFSADGRMLALAASEATDPVSSISLWSAASSQQLRALDGHKGRCMCVRFHPDGHLLASTEGGMTINLWDVGSGRILRTLKQGFFRSRAFGGAFRGSLAFSPNGRHLASRSWPVTIWDVYEGREVMTLSAESTAAVAAVCLGFSPDGQRLIEVRSDGTIRIWEPYRDQIVAVLGAGADRAGSGSTVLSAAISRDARLAAVATYTSTDEPKYAVAIWDLAQPRRLATLPSRDGSQALAFSPDGEWLALTDTTYGNGQASGVIAFQATGQLS